MYLGKAFRHFKRAGLSAVDAWDRATRFLFEDANTARGDQMPQGGAS